IHKVKLPSFHALEVRQILLPLRSSNQIETVQMACELAKLHGASIIALHIIEVPFSLPLETALPHRITMAGGVLKIAEAIAREEGVEISMEVVRARNIPEAIIDLAKIRSCDLMVLESSITTEKGNGLGHIITQILPRSPCRIWICHPAQDGEPLSGKPVADSQA
ncbi:MAG: universal stress protein, partial [Rhabdochlamydiaceae bacterium]